MKNWIYISILAFGLLSCTPDDDYYGPLSTAENDTVVTTAHEYAIILNEGNFMWGNASVSLIDIEDQRVQNDVFYKANGQLLGDVAQSIFIDQDTGYIVVNNSGKIELVQLPSFERIRTINGLTSPRYVTKYQNRLYVTDLYSGNITVMDQLGNVVSTISTGVWTERITATDAGLFVETVSDSIGDLLFYPQFQNQPLTLIDDAVDYDFREEGIYAFHNGNLSFIDVQTGAISTPDSTIYQPQSKVTSILVDSDRNRIYYQQNDIYSSTLFDVSDAELFYDITDERIYNWSVNPTDGSLFLVNVSDYTQNGSVLIVTPEGSAVNDFELGIIPSNVTFYSRIQ
tara:strand:+ start:22 stop:1047 length:1026 start_codon:yes stop_codon:yes gene_type:complete